MYHCNQPISILSDHATNNSKKNTQNSLNNLDTLPTPRLIPIHILLPLRKIRHPRTLHNHRIRPLPIIRLPAGPLNRILRILLIAPRPDPQPHIHRRLRERAPAIRLPVFQHAYTRPVDHPLYLFGRPENRVIVELLLRVRNGVVDRAVIGSGIALPEIIRLGVGRVPAHQFPVYFVQIVGFENDAADYAPSCRGFHDYFDYAEEEVELRLDGWCVAPVFDREGGAAGTVVWKAGGGVPGGGGGFEGEGVVYAQGWVGGTVGAVEGVAEGPGLGVGRREERGGRQGEGGEEGG